MIIYYGRAQSAIYMLRFVCNIQTNCCGFTRFSRGLTQKRSCRFLYFYLTWEDEFRRVTSSFASRLSLLSLPIAMWFQHIVRCWFFCSSAVWCCSDAISCVKIEAYARVFGRHCKRQCEKLGNARDTQLTHEHTHTHKQTNTHTTNRITLNYNHK